MRALERYRLRLRRKRFLWRAFRKRRELSVAADRTGGLRPDAILLFATLRNERVRLPYFLRYYRQLGIDHFIFVDNGSSDGTGDYLAAQDDVSVWHTDKSYRRSRYGQDWLTWLMRKHADGRWALTVDLDEFFVYPFCDTRPIRALTDWLDGLGTRAFPAMVLDMYPRGRIDAQPYQEGKDPFETLQWFDAGNYTISVNATYGNLWIQGGPRARCMFADSPEQAPSLNKVPLVKWRRDYCYVNSTHMLLPRRLNLTYDRSGGETASGCLLHAKFLSVLGEKVSEELHRKQHFADSREYLRYAETLNEDHDLWCKWSEKYVNWRQLEILGLMSKGCWA
ncbi:glycosyltransferase family 2 protein [Defluviimonas sp. WL0002]|uniref:Glycosyltransferase family 2 protein n=1 Tax=Albidovulum marisflavi TaxID=2984159 RepID=A0ABT2Z887_9RHOB|nr:glycosyltransferase family 2 protein [Defluviimonas sp. WL0002]MCV2867354.1 glycosyltransferase family 2 protein [Defluviimonas sp. WL0002]